MRIVWKKTAMVQSCYGRGNSTDIMVYYGLRFKLTSSDAERKFV